MNLNHDKIDVISSDSERFCGARDMDLLVAEKILEEFHKIHSINLVEFPEAKIKLMNSINKVRKALSSNREQIIDIKSLINDIDLSYKLTRDNFMHIISPILTKFRKLYRASSEKFKNLMGTNYRDIDSIESASDTLRTPCFNDIIKKVYDKELSKA